MKKVSNFISKSSLPPREYRTRSQAADEIIRLYSYRQALGEQLGQRTKNRGSIEAIRAEHDRVGNYLLFLSAFKNAIIE